MASNKPVPSSFVSTLWTLIWAGVSVWVGINATQETGWMKSMESLPGFLSVPLQYQSEAPIIRTLAGVLVGFLFFFATAYVLQGLVDALRLGLVNLLFRRAASQGRFRKSGDTPAAMRLWYYPLFNRVWADYVGTLHTQRVGEDGLLFRSTMPPEIYFNQEVLVDRPMRVEFFRHLPGILTGSGIVSTFAGILLGLTNFDPTVDATQVTTQLKHLFVGVSTAFVASFFAIFCAIIVTVTEKFLLHLRYGQVSALQSILEELFRGGVEPEYLARMVESGLSGSQKVEGAPQWAEGLRDGVVSAVTSGTGEMARGTAELNARLAQLLEVLPEALVKAVNSNAQGMASSQEQMRHSLEGLPGEVVQAVVKGTAGVTRGAEEMNARLAELVATLAIRKDPEAMMEVAVGRIIEALRPQAAPDIGAVMEATFSRFADILGGLTRELATGRQSMEQSMNRLLALNEEDGRLRGQILEQIRQAREEGNHSETELISRLDQLNALAKEAGEFPAKLFAEMRLLQEQGGRAEAALASQLEFNKNRDTWILDQMKKSGEETQLAMDIAVEEGLKAPVSSIITRVQETAQEQGQQVRQLHAELLNAFTMELQKIVGELINRLNQMTQHITGERQAMEASFRRLLEGLVEASRAGGDKLSSQMEKALAYAETRQDSLLEALSRFGTEMRSDINLLEQRMNQSSLEVATQVTTKAEDLASRAESETDRKLREFASSLSGDLKETLHALSEARRELYQQRDAEMLEKIAGGNAHMMDQVRDALMEGLAGSVRVMADSVNQATEVQTQRARELSDLLLSSVTGRVEEKFGNLSQGLDEIRNRVIAERDAIQTALQSFAANLEKSHREGGEEVASRVREAMRLAEERHHGMLTAIDRFAQGVSSDMGRLEEGILKKSDEVSSHLEQVVNTSSREQSVFIEMLGERLDTMRKRLKIV